MPRGEHKNDGAEPEAARRAPRLPIERIRIKLLPKTLSKPTIFWVQPAAANRRQPARPRIPPGLLLPARTEAAGPDSPTRPSDSRTRKPKGELKDDDAEPPKLPSEHIRSQSGYFADPAPPS